jgi:NADH-quinone oxidoreductase subunit I
MRMTPVGKWLRELWSLIRGLDITGRMLLKPGVTVHYPRQEVNNLESFRGPIALVPREDDPEKPRCIACMMCVTTCPSRCITVVKMKPPKPSGEDAEPGAKKPAAPKEPETYRYDYSLCSLCGLCVEVCPVDSIRFSTEAYLVTRDRSTLTMDLLAKLKRSDRVASEEKEA